MSMVFGGGVEPYVSGFSTARLAARQRRRSPARALLTGAAALLRGQPPLFASFAPAARFLPSSREEAAARVAFGRIAEAVGLAEDEQDLLSGGVRELSRLLLACETVGAALELMADSGGGPAWLRDQSCDEPFSGRAPLDLMAADGRLGVEMTLLHLRARLRCRRPA